mmetsp:Transcript_23331/g.68945  ORF Transcript_23331/g.68945 Transcript_23331/m.68945 type:complete len:88 (-) Transcript_23331:79-342(-)
MWKAVESKAERVLLLCGSGVSLPRLPSGLYARVCRLSTKANALGFHLGSRFDKSLVQVLRFRKFLLSAFFELLVVGTEDCVPGWKAV